MNELILSEYGMTEKKGIPVASSRQISEKFGKRHDAVIRAIENSECSDDFRKHNFVVSSYREGKGKYKEYLLTRDGFSFTVMGFTGKKAAQFKEAYITAFNQMESFIKNLLEAKADFPEFTHAIMAAHEEPKHYHFSNELDMINRIALGQSSKQFRQSNGIESGKSIRPYLNSAQLETVKSLQRIDIGLIIAFPLYERRKAILESQYRRLNKKSITA